MRKSNIFETVTTRGALLPGDFLTKLSSSTSEVKHTRPEDYNHPGEKLNEVISRAWNTLNINWKHFSEQEEKSTAVTRDRWLIPLFRELDYGNLKRAEKHTIDGKDYPISHTRDNVPIHLLGYEMELDHRTPGKTRQIPHSMMQEYLNKPETPTWGILSNGAKLRVLRENSSMTRQAFIEFDLEKMMESQAYSDFTLLYLICHESRFSLENKQKKQTIETWATQAKHAGIRALDSLRTGVKEAIEALGKGFLINQEIRNNLRDNEGYKQEYYRQLLRVAYRLIFLLAAESRELLLDPEAPQEAKDLYYKYYSLTRIRNLAERKRGTRHKDLWKALNVTITSLCKTEPTQELGIKPLGSFLWNEEATKDLNESDIENKHLCQAIRAITLTTKEGVTTRVDYRNLGSEELGSIYESLLEMRPEVNAEARQFKLNITAGNERKTTGSYYTPTELINELLNSALEPVIQQKKTEQEILETRVCDPACGSGHFLIAAAHRMARHLAGKRTEETEPDPETYRTALRDIISHCIYGVDINPMSVELCKVSLWLEAIEPGKPLNFLDHHIKCGNSLIGTSSQLMTDSETKLLAIPDDAFKPITGDDKKAASAFKKINKQQRTSGQRDLFMMTTGEDQTIRKLALQVAEIDHITESSINQLKQKEAEYKALTTSTIFNTEKTKADLWCAAFVQRKTEENTNPITTETLRAFSENPRTLKEEQREEIRRLAKKYQFFHWYIEFPEVFQRESKERSGFDVVLGNPPFINAIEGSITEAEKDILKYIFSDLSGTADIAYYFLCKANDVTVSIGSVGLVQPRSVMHTESLDKLRIKINKERPPALLYFPQKSAFFEGVSTYIVLIVLRNADRCRISDSPDLNSPVWFDAEVDHQNWWYFAQRTIGNVSFHLENYCNAVEEYFDVFSSMTTSEAYIIRKHIVDDSSAEGLRLVTTGLIDPNTILWGEKICRYIKKDYKYPILRQSYEYPKSLFKRIENAKRPKILIAGLADRIEACIDIMGIYMGAVSTFTIYEKSNDIEKLTFLMEWLNSEVPSEILRALHGAASVGNGFITLKKSYLNQMPLPKSSLLERIKQ